MQRFTELLEIVYLNPVFFPAKSSLKVGNAACPIIGVKIQRQYKGRGVDTASRKLLVTNKLLINLDLEGDVGVSLL